MEAEEWPHRAGASWTVAKLARQWDCSARQIYDLIDEGRLTAFSISLKPNADRKRGLRVSDAERKRWEQQNALASQPSSSGEAKVEEPLRSTTMKILAGIG